jgi:hypothetical protein
MTTPVDPAPRQIQEYAARAVDYVKRAVGLELAYDSDTLPLLDHYLRSVPPGEPATVELIALTAGAYFGEVVRHHLGGRWDLTTEDPLAWRVVLPTGIHFAPAGFAAAAILRDDLDDLDTALDAPLRIRPHLEQALARMGEVSFDDFYSLCGRLDTLEHVHEVLVAVAADMLGDADLSEGEGEGGDAELEPAAVEDDEPVAVDVGDQLN